MSSGNSSSIVSKSVALIDIIAASRKPPTFSEIMQRSGFAKSSTHRILAVLVAEGLVEHVDDRKTYTLGSKLVTWAQAAWQSTDIQKIAGRDLELLCERTGMNVALSILDNDAVLYLRTIDTHPARFAPRTGERAPLHCTAVGKVYLAFMDKRRRDETLARLAFEKYTELSPSSPEELVASLEAVRGAGFATCFQEEFLQINSLGAPVRNAQGTVCAGISLWTLQDCFTRDELLAHSQNLLAAAAKISSQMGYVPAAK